MRLSPGMVARYRAEGFLVFDPDLPPAEISAIRRALLTLHQRKAGFREGAQFDALGVDDGDTPARFPQILHPRSFAPELLHTLYFRQARAVAEQLLGPDMRFKADISLMKPALIGDATPWHQDEAFQDPAFAYDELSFWLALQPTDQASSCMAYIPGSHRWPVLPHGFPGDDARIHALECKAGFDPADAIYCRLPAGGCVIHNQRTLHGASPNTSDQDRLAYVLIFNRTPVPASTPRHFPWRAAHATPRAARERAWRRHGGLLVHLWRQRTRLRVANSRTVMFDLRRAARAVRRLWVDE